MKVAVTRSGGFAGMVRHAEVDSADHSTVARLIDAIDLDDLPKPKREPDRFVYDVQIGERNVQIGESDLRGPLRELVDQIMTLDR